MMHDIVVGQRPQGGPTQKRKNERFATETQAPIQKHKNALLKLVRLPRLNAGAEVCDWFIFFFLVSFLF